MKNIDTRRFRIYKSDEDGKWVLLLNGLDINTFRTWSIAYQYFNGTLGLCMFRRREVLWQELNPASAYPLPERFSHEEILRPLVVRPEPATVAQRMLPASVRVLSAY